MGGEERGREGDTGHTNPSLLLAPLLALNAVLPDIILTLTLI